MPTVAATFLLLCFLVPRAALCQSINRNDSIEVFSLLKQAEEFELNANYDSALLFINQAIDYSNTKNYKVGLVYALMAQTNIYIDKDLLNLALENVMKSKALAQSLKDPLIHAILNMQLGQIKLYQDKFEEAIVYLEGCTHSYFNQHPSKYSALAYNDLGYAYGQQGNLTAKANYIIKALQIYDEFNLENYGERAVSLNNLATVYYDLNQRQKAVEYAKQSLIYREKVGDKALLSLGCCNLSQMSLGLNEEESLKYQKLCIQYAEQSKNEQRIIHAYITSALIANHQKNIEAALNFELKAIEMLEKNNKDPQMLARRYISAGINASKIPLDSAVTIGYFNKAQQLSKASHSIENLRDVNKELSIFYKAHQDFTKAYNFYTLYVAYKDSIVNSNVFTNIAELEKKYETEKKDNEIFRLNNNQRIKALQIEKQQALLSANALESQKKENEIELLSNAKELQDLKIVQQEAELERNALETKSNQQQFLLIKKEQQLQQKQIKNSKIVRNFLVIGVVLLCIIGYFLFKSYRLKRRIQEQEALHSIRNNIAKDLHDEIGSTLTSIKILSEVSNKNIYKDQLKTSTYLQKITEQSSSAQQGISDIVWAVKPENDKLENMVIRMREYVAQTLESKNIETIISIEERVLNNTLDMNQRRDFFLLFKEAINNIAKYAQAKTVIIKLEKLNNLLLLEIYDDGIGFNVEKVGSNNGLNNMKSRAKSLQGTFEIYSEISKGTKLILKIPAT